MEVAMKLRINGNSLRLRLSRSEVTRFNDKLIIEDIIDFGSSKLTYVLSVSQHISAVSAKYDGGTIELQVPSAVALDWAATDTVSISAEQILDNGQTLQLLIEKDFKCAHQPPGEDADAYPNPLAEERKAAN
jgi:hypothetical protein